MWCTFQMTSTTPLQKNTFLRKKEKDLTVNLDLAQEWK